jgi:hypothetical protein
LKSLCGAAFVARPSHPGASLGILSAMRFATAVVALIVAVLMTGCGSLVLPKPDPTGDTALVAAMQKVCATTAPLAAINTSAGAASVTTTADADSAAVLNLQTRLLALTRTISAASPLAPTVTHLAELMLDVSRRYLSIVTAEQDLGTVSAELSKHYTSAATAEKARYMNELAIWPQLAVTRTTEAQTEFTKLGITICLS